MGQNNSKGSVSIPKKSKCFPYFTGENDLVTASQKAASSMTDFRNMTSVIQGIIFDAQQVTKCSFILSTTTYLIKFALDRLSNPTPSQGTNQQPNGNLEDTLIQLKIDKSIAQAAVAGFQAKLVAVNNRYNRLQLATIPGEDRRLEVIPALTLCEEILQLFRDANHVFARNPLASAPFVITFGGIYVSVAELCLAVLPSYRVSLVMQMLLLKDTLGKYAGWCVKARAEGLCFKMRASEQSMMDVGVEGVKELYLDDPFLKNASVSDNNTKCATDSDFNGEDFVKYESREEAIAAYKKMLQDKFNDVFGVVIEAVGSFSGFCRVDSGAGESSGSDVFSPSNLESNINNNLNDSRESSHTLVAPET